MLTRDKDGRFVTSDSRTVTLGPTEVVVSKPPVGLRTYKPDPRLIAILDKTAVYEWLLQECEREKEKLREQVLDALSRQAPRQQMRKLKRDQVELTERYNSLLFNL